MRKFLPARRKICTFTKKMRPIYRACLLYTSSKQCMEDEMGVSDKITSIAIPLGATVNMDAVSIVLSFMIVFFANACGVEVSTSMMIVILLANVILSVGTPGIPGGAIASFAALATMAGLPAGVIGV